MDISRHGKRQQLELNWLMSVGSIYMMGPFYDMYTFAAIQLPHHLSRQLADRAHGPLGMPGKRPSSFHTDLPFAGLDPFGNINFGNISSE
jgi:hypothetical protein